MYYVYHILEHHLVLFLVIQIPLLDFTRCSLVFDEANQEAKKNKYCSQIGECLPGTHVMCMYGDQHIMGPRCGNGRPLPLTEVEIMRILEILNIIRSQLVEGLNEFPKAYGMRKLFWDDTLADFAQTWANQCDGSRLDLCRATEKFPRAGQSMATKRFHYPNWDKVNIPIEVLNNDPVQNTRLEVINAYLEAVYSSRIGLTKEHIEKHPSGYRNSFLIAVYGTTTHVGCGMSTYPDYYRTEDNKPIIYHAVEVVCNFSSQPVDGEKVYETKPPGCPEGFGQEDGLCIESEKNEKEKDNTQNEKGDNSKEKKQDNEEKDDNSKEKGDNSKEKNNNSKEKGNKSKEKDNHSKENDNNSKDKGNHSKENGNNSKENKEKHNNSKEKGDNNKEKGENSKEKGNNSKEKRDNSKEKANNSKEKGNKSKEKDNHSKENDNNSKDKGNHSKENGNNSKENKEKHNNSKEKGDNSKEKGHNSKEKGNNSKEKRDNSKEKDNNSKEKGDNSKEKTEDACIMNDPKCSPHVVIMPIITIENGDPNKLQLHGLQGSQTPALTEQMALRKQLLRQKIKARVQNVRDRYFKEYVLLNPGTRLSNGGPIDEDTFVLSKHVPQQEADRNLKETKMNLSTNKRRSNIEIKSRRDFSDIDDVVSEYLLNLRNNKALDSQSNILASSVNDMRKDQPVKIQHYQNPNSQPLLNREQDRTYKEYNNFDNERERLLSDLNTSEQNFEDFAVNRYINNIATNKVIEDDSDNHNNLGAVNKEILHDDVLRNREITDLTDYEPQDYEEQQDNWSKRNQKPLNTHDQISNYDYSQLENYQGYRENYPQSMVIIDEYNAIQNDEKLYENSGIQNRPYVYDADEITHYYLDRLAPKVTHVTDAKPTKIEQHIKIDRNELKNHKPRYFVPDRLNLKRG